MAARRTRQPITADPPDTRTPAELLTALRGTLRELNEIDPRFVRDYLVGADLGLRAVLRAKRAQPLPPKQGEKG